MLSDRVYDFLTWTVPQLHYLAAALLLGRWLARREGKTAILAGAILLCLAVPLAGSPRALYELSIAPFVAVRYARVVLLDVWPALAYRTFELEWRLLTTAHVQFHSRLTFAENTWIGGAPEFNAILLILATMTTFFIRALVPAAAQNRMRGWMPGFMQPFWSNPWPRHGEGQRIWDINLCILVLCLVPIVMVGPLTALYLRARASHLLWPATWIAALWSLSRVLGQGARWILFKIMDSKMVTEQIKAVLPVANPTNLKKAMGFSFFYDMPELVAALALVVACCASVPLVHDARRGWKALGALLVCALLFQMFRLAWLPDMVGRGPAAALTIEDMQQLLAPQH
jgi:hypothetical protein